jgi:hypothetical protein
VIDAPSPTSLAGDGWPATVSFLHPHFSNLTFWLIVWKGWAGIKIDEFPYLDAWIERMLKRPGVEKGRHVPSPHTALDQRNMTEEELDKKAESSRAWVQQGMAADAKKKT